MRKITYKNTNSEKKPYIYMIHVLNIVAKDFQGPNIIYIYASYLEIK